MSPAFPRTIPAPATARSPKVQGFSLMELLTVISIIAAFAAIMIPFIVGAHDEANASAHRRNAQSLAATFIAGQTAGAEFLVPGDLEATIEKLVAGTVIEKGVFAGDRFAVPGLDEVDQAGAAQYLTLQGSRLIYKPNL